MLAFAVVAVVSTLDGGYFPATWGWVALWLCFVTVSTLILAERIEAGVPELTLLATTGLFLGWVAVSLLWTESVSKTVLEVQRGLVYLAAIGAVIALAGRRGENRIFAGVLAAIVGVSAYALASRLVPDLAGAEGAVADRLAWPLGYWNSLGIMAAMGALLSAGFAAHGRTRATRGAAAASLPVVLVTLALTFSRGAWIALCVGAICAIAASPQRLRLVVHLLALAPISALALWFALRTEGLSDPAAAVNGRVRFVTGIVALAVASAFMPWVADRVSHRIRIPEGLQRAARVAGLVAAAVAILVAVVAGPSLVGQATAAFRSSPGADADDLGERLFTISGNGRSDYWSVAWAEYTDHPVLGSGAGTYELYWTANRPSWFGARDAHNLYLEALAELGPVGLLLLLALLATPIAAFVIGRRTALSALGLAAYVAYLAHAAIDWDWEVPAVTLAALFCGAGAVIAARAGPTHTLRAAGRAAALGIAVLLGVFAFVTGIGNGAVAASERATAKGQFSEAESEAGKATRWAPWSAEAWLTLGRAQIDRGREEAARESFAEGLRRDRNDWRLWFELALASKGSERRSAFDEVRRLNPRSPELATLGEQ